MSSQAPAYLFAGYMVMHVFNRFLTAYVCDKPETANYAIGLVPLIGKGKADMACCGANVR